MPKWTADQQEAINARNSETLVSAAAGSGKTAVLIEHVLKLLREGGRVDRLLIITFTRAAAAELRERLTAALEKEAEDDPHLRRQIRAVRRASISTLHVFCQHVIRTQFQAVHVDPLAHVGESTVLEPLLTRALDESMEEMCAGNDPGDVALMRQYSDNQIVQMARQLHTFLRAQEDPEDWLDRFMRDPAGEGLRKSMLLLRKEALMLLEGAQQLCDSSIGICRLAGGPDYLADTFENDRMIVRTLQDTIRGDLPFAGEVRFPSRPRAPRNGNYDAGLTETAGTLRENMKELVKKACSILCTDEDEARRDVESTLPALRALIRMTQDMHRRYQLYKDERELLDYADLEHMALQALRDPKVCSQVADGYDAIFVDEYQDVSAIQEAIVRRIHNDRNRLFMVGDVKQSIYRFRLADPTLFLAKYDQFSDGKEAACRRILLSSNFRSRGNILAAVNCIFEKAMRRGATEIDYDEGARLRAGIPTRDDPPVELHVISDIPGTEEEDDRDGDETEETEAKEGTGEIRKGWMYEAQLAARRIRELVGTPIRDGGGERALRYRDCVILLRAASAHAPQIADILSSEGVPAFSDADIQYYELPEVRDMMDLLRVLDNPLQDVPLLSVLRGPCFRFTSERLARIRLTDETLQKPFYQVFFALRDTEEDVRHVCEKLDEWRLLSTTMTPDRLILLLLRETGMLAIAGAMPEGRLRQANLRMLAERAQSEGAILSLHHFLMTADIDRKGNDTGSARELSENDDVVRIMTLHKSKGLEFPVVILMETAHRFRMPKGDEMLRCDAQAGLALKRVDPESRITGHTLCGKALEYKRRREIRAEEARLLYVGMTRARERLILLSSPKSVRTARLAWSLPEGDYAAGQAGCMLDWIGQALWAGLREGRDGLWTAENGSVWDIRFHNGASFRQSLPPEKPFTVPDWTGEVAPDFLRLPPRSAPRMQKISVTAVIRGGFRGDDEEETIQSKRRALQLEVPLKQVPDFMSEKKTSGADRGVATHKALCALDPERELQPQLEALLRRGYYTEEEYRLIRLSDVRAFFDSDLGRRSRASSEVHREWGFTLRDGVLLVQGVLDLCFLENGRWILVDYKTDACPAEELPAKYGPQLRWYARALRELTDYPPGEMWLYSLRERRALQVSETE